jgi:hypothetical protein
VGTSRRWIGRSLVVAAAVFVVGASVAVPASSVVGEPTVDQAYRFLAKVEIDTVANQVVPAPVCWSPRSG